MAGGRVAILRLTIEIPAQYVGDVVGYLNAYGAHIERLDSEGIRRSSMSGCRCALCFKPTARAGLAMVAAWRPHEGRRHAEAAR
jgi:hypothetical protein